LKNKLSMKKLTKSQRLKETLNNLKFKHETLYRLGYPVKLKDCKILLTKAINESKTTKRGGTKYLWICNSCGEKTTLNSFYKWEKDERGTNRKVAEYDVCGNCRKAHDKGLLSFINPFNTKEKYSYYGSRPNKHLYFINMLGTTFYKIGVSSNVNERLKGMQTANPLPCKVVYNTVKLESYDTYEKSFHYEYETKRLKGEWFNFKLCEAYKVVQKMIDINKMPSKIERARNASKELEFLLNN
jgi:hypothetical protein